MNDENNKAVAVLNELAPLYQDKYMDVTIYKDPISSFCEGLSSDARILDIACGPGNILKHLKEINPYFKLHGMDLSEEMIRLATQNVPGAKFSVKDCRLLEGVSGNYDGIICNFLIPYLNEKEVEKLIRQIARLLSKKGRLMLGFITDHINRYEKVLASNAHELIMNYYSDKFIVTLLQKNNLKVEFKKEYLSPNLKQHNKDIIIIAAN